jgi:hypothetical protein
MKRRYHRFWRQEKQCPEEANYAKYMNSKESKLYLKECCTVYGKKENSVLWESDIIRRLH